MSELARCHGLFKMDVYRMALSFDPKISAHFKVICPIRLENDFRVVVFSSESGMWTTSILQVPWHVNFNPVPYGGLHCRLLLINGGKYLIERNHESIVWLDLHKESVELVRRPAWNMSYNLRLLGKWKGCLQWCQFCRQDSEMRVWELQDCFRRYAFTRTETPIF